MQMEAGNFLESFRGLDKLSITLKLRMTGDLHRKTQYYNITEPE
jgi:hypothetical protein